MRRLLCVMLLVAFGAGLSGCADEKPSRPDTIPPMPKGDKKGDAPGAGSAVKEG